MDVDALRIKRFEAENLGRDWERAQEKQLAGDASSRRYYRLQTDSASMILTLYPEAFQSDWGQDNRLSRLRALPRQNLLSYANDPLAQLELTGALHDLSIAVPAILQVNGILGIVAFEDLGDRRLYDDLPHMDIAARRRAYRDAICILYRLQMGTSSVVKRCPAVRYLAFSEQKFMWELDFFLRHFFEGLCEVKLPPAISRSIHRELRPLCQWLARRPKVLTHRDYHARNLMVHQGELKVIDYQDARLGPASYDLVSLLLDPYVKPEWVDEEAGLELYLDLFPQSREAFLEEYRAMAVQRLLKAAGTYAAMAGKGQPAYLGYLASTLSRARGFMAQAGGFPTLEEALAKESHRTWSGVLA